MERRWRGAARLEAARGTGVIDVSGSGSSGKGGGRRGGAGSGGEGRRGGAVEQGGAEVLGEIVSAVS